jgi:formate C-acetyltransferase
MMTAAAMPRDLAARYAALCRSLASKERDELRRGELLQMAENLGRVPWEPPATFWEAVQALWLNHMLIMSDENYPGPVCRSGASTSTSIRTGSIRSTAAWTASSARKY